MREIGYATVDALVDRVLQQKPISREAAGEALEARLGDAPPEAPTDYMNVLGAFMSDVEPYRARTGAGGYLAFIPAYATWPGALADLLASALNLDTCWWRGGAGPSHVEVTVLRWFMQWIGYPPSADGVLTSGGSAANMTALACAREHLAGPMRDDLTVYVSDQSHSSVARACRALGFRPERLRVLPVDDRFRLRVDVLEHALEQDRRSGLVPLAVCANAGTTNTGAIDPLPELAAVCAEHGSWLHVDGAYGAFAALTERGRDALRGIELADSVTLDPHKWLFQPFECGALLVRRRDALRNAFAITPDYLRDVEAGSEPNFSDRGLQLTRYSRALKVWLSVQTFGLSAFRQAIDHGLDLAREAASWVEAAPNLELLAPPTLGIVAVRRHPSGVDDEERLSRLNEGLVAEIERSGELLVSSTRLRGRTAVRLCFLNPTTTRAHAERAVEMLVHLPVDEAQPPPPPAQRDWDVESVWPTGRESEADIRAVVPLFRQLDTEALALLAQAPKRRLGPGEALVEQWDSGRDVLVILEGRAVVEDEDGEIARLEAGDVVGEIAALDWGAGYGALRTTRVRAETAIRVLTIDPLLLQHLAKRAPAFRAALEATADEHRRRSARRPHAVPERPA
jgi:aromatic-L-amino-acid/L-tryptophan decarboxylase